MLSSGRLSGLQEAGRFLFNAVNYHAQALSVGRDASLVRTATFRRLLRQPTAVQGGVSA